MMFQDSLPPFLELVAAGYSMQMSQFGASPTGVLWKDASGQQERFSELLSFIDHQGGEISINDLGCGYGALYDYLVSIHFNNGDFRYFGADICHDMVIAANRRVNDTRAQFRRSYRVLQDADYGLVSGTFNMKGTAEDSMWSDYVKQSLKHLFNQSRVGIAFNLHDAIQKKRLEWTYYADRKDILKFCREELSADVTLKMNKKRKEFTVYVSK